MARARSFRELEDLKFKIDERARSQRRSNGTRKPMSRLSRAALENIFKYEGNIRNAYKGYAKDWKARNDDAYERAYRSDDKEYDAAQRDIRALDKERIEFQNKKISPRIYREGGVVG